MRFSLHCTFLDPQPRWRPRPICHLGSVVLLLSLSYAVITNAAMMRSVSLKSGLTHVEQTQTDSSVSSCASGGPLNICWIGNQDTSSLAALIRGVCSFSLHTILPESVVCHCWLERLAGSKGMRGAMSSVWKMAQSCADQSRLAKGRPLRLRLRFQRCSCFSLLLSLLFFKSRAMMICINRDQGWQMEKCAFTLVILTPQKELGWGASTKDTAIYSSAGTQHVIVKSKMCFGLKDEPVGWFCYSEKLLIVSFRIPALTEKPVKH